MATLVSAVDTVFTPATGTFNVQCTRGNSVLQRRQTAGADWAIVGMVKNGDAFLVDNPVASAQYRFVKTDDSATPTVQADQ